MKYTLILQPEETDFPHEMSFGSFDRRWILRDGEPYLCVWVEQKPLWVEEDTALFGDFLLIGMQDAVRAVRLSDLSVQEFPVNFYFKQFLVLGDVVYVFDAWGIFALDLELHILWQNRDLAVDGVLPQDMPDDHTLHISCEMDPPGGWIDRTINLQNGELL